MPVETPPRRPRKPCGMAPKDRARITSTLLVIASALSETYGRWPIRRGDGQRLEQSAHLRRCGEAVDICFPRCDARWLDALQCIGPRPDATRLHQTALFDRSEPNGNAASRQRVGQKSKYSR